MTMPRHRIEIATRPGRALTSAAHLPNVTVSIIF